MRRSRAFSGKNIGPDPIDKVTLQKLEIHFFYPFYLIEPKTKSKSLKSGDLKSQNG